MLVRRDSAAGKGMRQQALAGAGRLSGTGQGMPAYRVYFMDDRDHIVAALDIGAVDDGEAIRQGVELGNAAPGCAAAEVWQQARLVHRYNKTAA
jgi:hypothetical protein